MMQFLISRLHASAISCSCFSACKNSRGLPTDTARVKRCTCSIPLSTPFDGHTQRQLVDYAQDEMTLEYLSEGFESLIEPVLFRVGVEPPKEIGGGRLLEFNRGDEA